MEKTTHKTNQTTVLQLTGMGKPTLAASHYAKDLRSVYHQLRRTLHVQIVIKLWNSLPSLKQANHSKLLT